MTERRAPQPRFLPEIAGTSASRREFGQSLPNVGGQESHLAPESFDFLDFSNPIMRQRAQELGFESGRVYLNLKTYGFLVRAQGAGVIDEVRQINKPESFEKFCQIHWFLAFTDASSTDLASYFGYKQRQGPVAFLSEYYRRIYLVSPLDVRGDLSIEDVSVKKEKPTDRYRDKISSVRGGKLGEARILIESGLSDYRQLAQEIGITDSAARILVRKFRKDNLLPKTNRAKTLLLKRRVEIADDVEEFAAILRLASPHFVKSSPMFESIRQFLIENGYKNSRRNRRLLVRALQFNQEPFKKVTFRRPQEDGSILLVDGYYYLTKQRSRIDDIVKGFRVDLDRREQ